MTGSWEPQDGARPVGGVRGRVSWVPAPGPARAEPSRAASRCPCSSNGLEQCPALRVRLVLRVSRTAASGVGSRRLDRHQSPRTAEWPGGAGGRRRAFWGDTEDLGYAPDFIQTAMAPDIKDQIKRDR
ncbi:uncharacterized protein LOC106998550 [Macaca mulatta]